MPKNENGSAIPQTYRPCAPNIDITTPIVIAYTKVNMWSTILKNNKYIGAHSDPKNSPHSLSSLVPHLGLSQSQKIQLGHCMDYAVRDAIVAHGSGWSNIRKPVRKGEKETDHLWVHEETKKLVYAEFKANIELDTEKSKATDEKCADIAATLAKENPGYTITYAIVALRYLDSREEVAKSQIKKYTKTAVMGINEYLRVFGIPEFAEYPDYVAVIKEACAIKFA